MIIHPNFVFVHLQKCAGTFVETFLLENIKGCESAWPKHRGILSVDLNCKDKIKFGMIRNPFDWYVSWWAKESQSDVTLFPEILTEAARENFNVFLQNIDKADFGLQHDIDGRFLKKYSIGALTYRFINAYTNGSNLIVDYVLKLEEMYDKLPKILNFTEELKEVFKSMSKIHTSKHSHYSEYYNQESIDIVYNKDKLIIEKFGYNYEENTDN